MTRPGARLSTLEVADERLTGWAQLNDALHTRLETGRFATGLALVQRIGAAAEAADHHPDIDLRYAHVAIRLTSHDVGGITGRDVALARRIDALASDAGVSANPLRTASLELALDTPAHGVVRPFWSAVLAMDGPAGHDGDLTDSALPPLWFQASGSEEPRQRFHLDLWVPPEVVDERIEAALQAGGALVSDAHAPSFWVLADPEDNRVCLCTWQGR